MISKIVNMADQTKDAMDRHLESLLRPDAIADNGFSATVMSRIRRRLWLRRLTLPVAALIGAAIAFKPMLSVAGLVSRLTALAPLEAVGPSLQLPQLQVIVFGAILLAASLFALKLSQD